MLFPYPTDRPRVLVRALASLLTLLLLGGGICVAQQDESKTAPEPIDKHMRRLMRLISNAKVKLDRGMGGVARGEDSANLSPGWACCAPNLKRIERSAVAVQSMLLQLEDCYEDRDETDAAIAVRLSMNDLAALARSVQAFADARTSGRASAAMDGMTRTYLNLSDSTAKLPECGVLLDPSDVPSDDDESPSEDDSNPR
jgi:hypothetical protein